MIEVKVLDRDGIRIDKYLNEEFDISRSRIKKLIADEKILVNGKSVKASYLVKMDDVISVDREVDKYIVEYTYGDYYSYDAVKKCEITVGNDGLIISDIME